MNIKDTLLEAMEQQAEITRRFLPLVPTDKFDWKPNPKSMSIQQLTTHIAELPGWVSFGLTTDELDFAKNHYEPAAMHTSEEIVAYFDKTYAEGKAALVAADEKELDKTWTMRSAEKIHAVMTKAQVIRMSIDQTIHHRAQLGVYFRLLGIGVPPSFGPTADFPAYE